MSGSTCPSCHDQVLTTPNGLLEPEPHMLGVHTPTGATLTAADIRARVRGHRKHWCQPTTSSASTNQTALFD